MYWKILDILISSKYFRSTLLLNSITFVSFISEKRYGDQLNPWGDIITMGRAWCQMKPGSRALVGLPAAKDTICFNAHRLYGSFLFQHLFANFRHIYSEGDPNILKNKVDCRTSHNYQPMHILEKVNRHF